MSNIFFLFSYFSYFFGYTRDMSHLTSSLWETLLRKWFWLYAFGYAIAPIGYFIKILVAWHVSVSDLGILYGVISLVTLLTAFSDLGMSEMMKYYIPKYETQKKYDEIKSILTYAALTQVCTGIILWVIFFAWAEWIGIHYFSSPEATQTIKVFSLFFLWINIFQIIITAFLAMQNTFWYKCLELIRMWTILFMTAIFAFTDVSDLATYASSWIIWLYIWVIVWVIVFFAKWYRWDLAEARIIWSWKLAKKVFSYAIMTFLSAQAAIILSQVDMQMIILLLSTQDAWYYSVYLSLIMIPFLLIWPIFPLLTPLCSNLYEQKSFDKIAQLKTFFQKYFGLAGISFGIFLFIFWKYIVSVLFWNTFLLSGYILQFSSLFLVWNFLLQINFAILSGIGKVAIRFKIIVASIWINIILNYFFIQAFGVAGAALATGVWWAIIFFASNFFLKDQFPSSYNGYFLWKNMCIIFVLSSVSVLIIEQLWWVHDSRMINFLIVSVFWVLWAITLIAGNYTEWKMFIKEIKKLRNITS